jgi:adenine deaminase
VDCQGLIRVARGEQPADVLITGAQIVNTFTAEVETGNLAIYQGYVAGVGDYQDATRILDLHQRYLVPGFINSHTHVESSLLSIDQYARAVVPRGTLAVITDLHEMANVCGLPGLRHIVAASRRLPFDLFLMVPSCVPATSMETAGAELDVQQIRTALRWRNTLGLGEVMQFPGVIGGDSDVLQKIRAAGRRPIDGHAPGVMGKALNAYVAAGIRSCHESTTVEEGREKLRRGMHLMIRQGSAAQNLETLLPLVTDDSYPRCLLVVDDRSCVDLYRDGDIDAVVRQAIALGLEPIRAIQMATINPARYFGLHRLGAIAPGTFANFLVVGDLHDLDIQMVFYQGKLVARDGQPQFMPCRSASSAMMRTMHVRPFDRQRLVLHNHAGAFPVIGIVPGQIVTTWITAEPTRRRGVVVPDIQRDLVKIAVVERHKATGNIGLGLVRGFGLRKGALASSIAHDAHNIVAIGTSDADLYLAIKEVERLEGGLVVVADGTVVGALALPIAGLLSPDPLEAVVARLENLEKTAVGLGVKLAAPFATLSFLALPVIPELRLTDKGLVDVCHGAFVDQRNRPVASSGAYKTV